MRSAGRRSAWIVFVSRNEMLIGEEHGGETSHVSVCGNTLQTKA